jgi:hypothetical protein
VAVGRRDPKRFSRKIADIQRFAAAQERVALGAVERLATALADLEKPNEKRGEMARTDSVQKS